MFIVMVTFHSHGFLYTNSFSHTHSYTRSLSHTQYLFVLSSGLSHLLCHLDLTLALGVLGVRIVVSFDHDHHS